MKINELVNGTKAQVAEYREQEILEYQGNPLIEALPPIYSQEEVIDRLSMYPPYNVEERYMNDHQRVHLISRLLQYFQAIPIHLKIESSISRLIRTGYTYRNPVSSTYAQSFVDNWNNIQNKSFDKSIIQTGQTLSILGVSGVGKTRTLQRILQTIPQVISHVSYKGKALNHYQITYLKIETPFDGSVKTIIYDFMYQVDLLLGSNYFNRYVNSHLSTSQLMPIMAQIAKSINLGMLFLDELQHLKGIKSSRSSQILNFFTALINTINIPLIMVGTPKAMDVLQSQFRQARRSTNMGNIMWDRFEKNDIWDLFVSGMWKYQWIKEDVLFTEEISSTLYDESQGIADIAIKLYMMVQLRAISSCKERITTALIKQVAQEELKMVQPMLNMLKSKDYSKLAKYDDLMLPKIEDFMEQERITVDQKQVMNSLQEGAKRKNEQLQLIDDATFRLGMLGFNNDVAVKAVQKAISENNQLEEVSQIVKDAFLLLNNNDKSTEKVISNDLRTIIKKGKEQQVTAYQALLDAGVIKQDYPERVVS
ncbi:ATP-binding protein [Evansella cellulosilytica]|uniref:RuvA domain protein n=1 Tax=Evansella cellulosilytica (strain ATCC 21833 / DSM 2522 / FERM P-1141 / JCM 9156 / N-4) TaxID=649639 RepID=E6TU47_EVAC2|nr:ATP-binding protein [Evansella cellulosilytica]ADU28507.1 RuvA domain protein [Evansella cellulosilytica DSM 2522]